MPPNSNLSPLVHFYLRNRVMLKETLTHMKQKPFEIPFDLPKASA